MITYKYKKLNAFTPKNKKSDLKKKFFWITSKRKTFGNKVNLQKIKQILL